jgi:carbon monoxide dehydrogenase subunit G
MSRYSFVKEVPVTPEAVWEIVADHRGMSGWTPVRRVELETEGDPSPNGVGAVRALYAVGPPIRERVTAFEPSKRLSYEALSGVPARDYTGEIALEPTATGTRITWTIDFRPKVPGAQFALAAAIKTATRLLAKESVKRGGAG